jgi:hypothetical protein
MHRKYDLFVGSKQFAEIDAQFLAWDFAMQDSSGAHLASVNKNFTGIGRELFTDSSQYVIRLDGQSLAGEQQLQLETGSQTDVNNSIVKLSNRSLSTEERAVALACAISIDYDYFSRHSAGGGLASWMPTPFSGGSSDAVATDVINDQPTQSAGPSASTPILGMSSSDKVNFDEGKDENEEDSGSENNLDDDADDDEDNWDSSDDEADDDEDNWDSSDDEADDDEDNWDSDDEDNWDSSDDEADDDEDNWDSSGGDDWGFGVDFGDLFDD